MSPHRARLGVCGSFPPSPDPAILLRAAGQRAGIYPDRAGFSESWALERTFDPQMDETERADKYTAWKRAVDATMSF